MGDEKDAFYVVHKGDVIAVYKNLSDLQALLRSSVGEPAISVYKGYHLAKQSEEYLASHGLKNAMYSMDFSDVRDDLFGILVPCPFRQPGSSKDKIIGKNLPEKRMQMEVVASPSFSAAGQQKHATLDNCLEIPPISSYCTQGIWKCKNQNMAELSKIVKELKDHFVSFQINHIYREFNTEADAQANLAVYLKSKGLSFGSYIHLSFPVIRKISCRW